MVPGTNEPLQGFYPDHMPPLPKHPVIDGHKTCSVCGVSEPVAAFYEVKKGTGRLFAACKVCIVAQQTAYPRPPSYLREWRALTVTACGRTTARRTHRTRP